MSSIGGIAELWIYDWTGVRSDDGTEITIQDRRHACRRGVDSGYPPADVLSCGLPSCQTATGIGVIPGTPFLPFFWANVKTEITNLNAIQNLI